MRACHNILTATLLAMLTTPLWSQADLQEAPTATHVVILVPGLRRMVEQVETAPGSVGTARTRVVAGVHDETEVRAVVLVRRHVDGAVITNLPDRHALDIRAVLKHAHEGNARRCLVAGIAWRGFHEDKTRGGRTDRL